MKTGGIARPGRGWRRSCEPESYLPGGHGECPARVPGDSHDSSRLPQSALLKQLSFQSCVQI